MPIPPHDLSSHLIWTHHDPSGIAAPGIISLSRSYLKTVLQYLLSRIFNPFDHSSLHHILNLSLLDLINVHNPCFTFDPSVLRVNSGESVSQLQDGLYLLGCIVTHVFFLYVATRTRRLCGKFIQVKNLLK